MHRISQKFSQNVTLLLVLTGVPIKKGAVEAISAGTFVGMSKERAIKQEKLKEDEVWKCRGYWPRNENEEDWKIPKTVGAF